MAIVHSLPVNSETLNPSVNLIMTFDNTSGEYVFDNTRYELLKLNSNNSYLLESITIGANISNVDFTTARNADVMLSLYYSENPNQRADEFPTPFNITSVDVPVNTNTWFFSQSGDDDTIEILPSGRLQQLASMIGLSEVILTIQAEIYRTDDSTFNDDIRKPGA